MDSATRRNEALILKHHLLASGQTHWGFAIYRCTYTSSALWTRFLEILRHWTRSALSFWNAPELLATLSFPIHDNRALLDAASKDTVRRLFREWAATVQEPGSKEVFPARYRYCVYVDEGVLEAVVEGAGQQVEVGVEAVGYVVVIDAGWGLEEEEEEEEGEEEVEGCTRWDVGWMRVTVDGVAFAMYWRLGESGGWDVYYVRPPEICTP